MFPNPKNLLSTIKANGGITYSIVTGNTPSTGYAVAIPGHEEKHRMLDADDLADYIHRHKWALDGDGNHLGAWFDSESQIWYLDVSKVLDDEKVAETLAAAYGQKAYFDLESKLTFHVPTWRKYFNEDGTPIAL